MALKPLLARTPVSTAPAHMAGEKLNMSFLNGPENSASLARCALTDIEATEMPAAMPASPSHVTIQFHGSFCRDATSAAPVAVMPMRTCPHPESAVKVAARS